MQTGVLPHPQAHSKCVNFINSQETEGCVKCGELEKVDCDEEWVHLAIIAEDGGISCVLTLTRYQFMS